ncbi:MAG: sodium:proton antiporter [Candidatus Sumerlaeota bacterium]
MNPFQILAILMTTTAIFSYVNHRFIRLPMSIGVMLVALLGSLTLVLLHKFGIYLDDSAIKVLKGVEFGKTLMQGLLSFLLFAGALQINLSQLYDQKISVIILSTVGLLISVFVCGLGTYLILRGLGVDLGLAYCFLFGALISPTDPIAVLSILKIVKVPKSLEINIACESLFNDGVGVVAFIIISEIALEAAHISLGHIGMLFLVEAVGGAVFGLAIGAIAYYMLKSIDNYQVEVLITLALVTGGYALASSLHLSGPIAIVVAGLMIGNQGRRLAMSDTTREHLDLFWELIDEILNSFLFVLIGLQVLLLRFSHSWIIAGILVSIVLIGSRWLSVAIPVNLMKPWKRLDRGAISILTWGGLRGGISVALALSIPPGAERDLIVTITYIVVIVSISIQGLTVKSLIRYLYPQDDDEKTPHSADHVR